MCVWSLCVESVCGVCVRVIIVKTSDHPVVCEAHNLSETYCSDWLGLRWNLIHCSVIEQHIRLKIYLIHCSVIEQHIRMRRFQQNMYFYFITRIMINNN